MSQCAVTNPCGQKGMPHSSRRCFIFAGRFEDRGACNDHLKFPIDAAEPRQHAFASLADQPHRETARVSFSGNSVFCKPGWP